LRRVGALLRWQWGQPGIRALLSETTGRNQLGGRWIYVTDGGNYENLGVVEALRRGATEIVAFDASEETAHSWAAFGQAVETARADLGVEIALTPAETMTAKEGVAAAPTVATRATFTYPNGTTGTLWLCKLAYAASGSKEVPAAAKTETHFLDDAITQRLHGDREFEAYRRLGEISADMALTLMAEHAAAKRRRRPRGSSATPAPVTQRSAEKAEPHATR
jgi:hypothetical protein